MGGDGAPAPLPPIERDVELAWELFDVQPDHPEVGRLTRRVLAEQPDRNGIRILLALHLKACEELDEARTILLDVAGQRDQYFADVARKLRGLELYECNYDEARRWAETVVEEDPEDGQDRIELGAATAMGGDLEAGWQLIDEGVALAGRNDPDNLPHALISRAIYLLQSFAPPQRFIPAAEEAMRADVASEFVGGPLGWAYVHEGRFEDAEQLARRLLRQDPTDGLAEGLVTMIGAWRRLVDSGEVTFAEIHESGAVAMGWAQMRDQLLGTDLDSALAALEHVLPAELAAALRPPLDPEAARESPGEREIARWHDGQEPGTGDLWGVDGTFRLMSSAEIEEMDDAIEADPETWAAWQQEAVTDYYSQVMTDDRGGYLLATLGPVVIRRAGVDDEVVAPGLADWFWDRVAAFGGRDPRPDHR